MRSIAEASLSILFLSLSLFIMMQAADSKKHKRNQYHVGWALYVRAKPDKPLLKATKERR